MAQVLEDIWASCVAAADDIAHSWQAPHAPCDPGGSYDLDLRFGDSYDLASGSTDSERTPWAPWTSTPSMSAVADGPVWNTV